MGSKLILVVILALLLGIVSTATAQEPITINWFVGLGTGDSPEQVDAQNQVVEAFNAAHDDIELVIQIVTFDQGRDTLSTLIAAGTPPDIVGPVGVGGSNAFIDQWLDIAPLVESTGYDVNVYEPALLELYRTADGGLVGMPFALFPAITYYNRGLFDEAGLNYPPQTFDTPYVMPDGTEVPWNYETVAELAKILTVDANGNDATMEEFEPENIVQFGFRFQYAGQRLMWTDIQPEIWYDAESNTITIPDSWRTATHWMWDGVWTDHTIPSTTYAQSELLANDNAFASGNLGMAVVPTWYTCCLNDSIGNFEWDIAVVPQSLDGEHHVAVDADTFRILEASPNHEAAFTALSYLLNEGLPTLAPVYGAIPAIPEYRQGWVDSKDAQYDWGINWQVALDSLSRVNTFAQHHESFHPNYQKGTDRVAAFQTLLYGDTGADIDVDVELDTLQADLQAIIEE
jgi:multiple sugar transport system substrate-binding protein